MTTKILRLASFPKICVHLKESSAELSLSEHFSIINPNDQAVSFLEEYLQGKNPIWPLSDTTLFQSKVYQALNVIPFGKTMTYQEIANICGNPKGSRAVGNACNKNPYPLFIPCHRAVHKNEKKSGYKLCLEIKKRLLSFEAS